MPPALLSTARRLAAALALGFALAGGPAAQAMSLSPMVAEISVTGAGSSARIQVGNELSDPMPYETHITRVDFDADGTPHETPADDDFLVFPPQGIVQPKSNQVIRVQWIADPDLKSSRCYYLEVRQIPVDVTPQSQAGPMPTAHVLVVYRIKAMLTVAPHGATSKVSVVSVESTTIQLPAHFVSQAGGAQPPPPPPEPGLKVTLENDGTRHALMGGVNWIVEGTGADGKPFSVQIPAQSVGGAVGIGYLPPDGGRRIFQIPFDKPVQGPLTIRFTE